MQIFSVNIKNFRSIEDAQLTIEPLTALIGGNNAGKSTILKAIEVFLDPSPKLTIHDWTTGKEDETIEITIGFTNITDEEAIEFGSAISNDKMLVTREFRRDDKEFGQYSVQARRFPGFEDIRSEGNGTKKRNLYNNLKAAIPELGAIQSHQDIDGKLEAWELHNPSVLVESKARGFFGAINVATGKLRKKTSVHLVPAVRDASDEIGGSKRSPIINLGAVPDNPDLGLSWPACARVV